METISGWILDVYPVPAGMVAWLIADDGRRIRAVDLWQPSACVSGAGSDIERLRSWIELRRVPVTLTPVRRREYTSGRDIPVTEVRIGNAERFRSIMAQAMRAFPSLKFFNADIAVDRMWFYETGRFPLARVSASLEGETLRGLSCLDSIWDTDYAIPPFSVLGLRLAGRALNPAHTRTRNAAGDHFSGLELHLDGEVRVLDAERPRDFIERFNDVLVRHDPDLIVTEYGDAWLLPKLAALARRCGVALKLNRDPTRAPLVSRSRSYFTYGRIVHRDETWTLFGRLHLDRRNSFTLDETGFDGLFETARLARLPLQTCARTSTGTGISSMQVAQAISEGILVPVDKDRPEDFKGADELLAVDKGGLVFQPEVGVYENVAELDFASMYPAIIVKHNLSPETLGCECCREDGDVVPETGKHSCVRRQGLIPRTLAPLLVKRQKYKVLKRSAPTEMERKRAAARVAAHKWLLVCCFGYLGYRNARFGRIESHEATTAWGREALLRAKETAESLGFHMIHAIVDSLWVHRPGETLPPEEYESLARKCEEATGLPISFEGVYNWIAFLPSREDARRAVAQRYVGTFASGEVKARGIEARRVDTPAFVRDLQTKLIEELSRARTVAEARGVASALVERVIETVQRVRSGRMRPDDLAIFRRMSKEVREYRAASPVAVAAGQLASRGVRLEAGEKIGYVLGSDRPYALQIMEDGVPYDSEKYVELTLKAAGTVLGPFGCSFERLAETVTLNPDRPKRRTSPKRS